MGSKDRWDGWGRVPITPPWRTFFSLLQKNVLDRQRWFTRADLRLVIVTWIEKTYHRKRRQRRLGRVTPVEFETINSGLKAA